MKQKLIELLEDIDKYSIIVGDFNTSFSLIDRISRWKISENIEDSNNTIKQFYLIDIYRIIHSITVL